MNYLILALSFLGLILSVLLLSNVKHQKKGVIMLIASFVLLALSIFLIMQTQPTKDDKYMQDAPVETSSSDESSESESSIEDSSTSSEPEPESNSSESSDEFNADYALEDFIKTNTSYSDVSVKGTYVANPYTCAITINDRHDFRIVVSDVLEAFHDNAGSKLNNFDEINIQVKNGSQTLKTSYPVSTIMHDNSVYRPTKVESIATQWIIR